MLLQSSYNKTPNRIFEVFFKVATEKQEQAILFLHSSKMAMRLKLRKLKRHIVSCVIEEESLLHFLDKLVLGCFWLLGFGMFAD